MLLVSKQVIEKHKEKYIFFLFSVPWNQNQFPSKSHLLSNEKPKSFTQHLHFLCPIYQTLPENCFVSHMGETAGDLK